MNEQTNRGPLITLEQFRATRREVPDLSTAICDNGGDLKGQRGFVYAGDVYMSIYDKSDAHPERRVGLVLNGWDWLKPESQLPELEEQLYEWAALVGAIDSAEPALQTMSDKVPVNAAPVLSRLITRCVLIEDEALRAEVRRIIDVAAENADESLEDDEEPDWEVVFSMTIENECDDATPAARKWFSSVHAMTDQTNKEEQK
jgi:hypothetical protein